LKRGQALPGKTGKACLRVSKGRAELVRNSVNRCVEKMGEKRAMISADCEIPRCMPYENPHAAEEVLRAYGAVPALARKKSEFRIEQPGYAQPGVWPLARLLWYAKKCLTKVQL